MARVLPLFISEKEVESDFDHELTSADSLILAQKYFRIGDMIRAERLCEKVILKEPQNVAALNILARIKVQAGKYRQTLVICDTILHIDSRDYHGHCAKGICYLALKETESAISAYRSAMEIAPEQSDAYMGLGIALTQAGNFEQVEKCFKKAAQVAPRNGEVFACLGRYFLRNGDLKGSVQAFLQAVENDELRIEYYIGLNQAADALLEEIEKSQGIPGNGNIQYPKYQTAWRTYRFSRFLPHREVIGSYPVIYVEPGASLPLMLKHMVNYYAELPARFPAFWNHADVSLECHRDHYYVQDQHHDVIPTVLSHFESHAHSSKCPYYHGKHDIGLVGMAPIRHKYRGEPFLVMDIAGYFGHFICDELPYLILARELPEIRQMKILVPKLNAINFKFLDFLGYPRERLITWNDLVQSSAEPTSISIEDAWFPITLPLPLSLEIVRHEFHTRVAIPNRPGHRKLYITRGGQRMINEKAVEDALRNEGFEIIRPEHMSVADQLRLFGEAGLIVGGIGSGMASMVWAPRGTSIIEIMSEARPSKTTYVSRNIELMMRPKTMCQSLGHDFYRVSGKAIYELGESVLLDHVTCQIEGRMRDVHFTNVLFKCDPEEVVHAVHIALEARRLS